MSRFRKLSQTFGPCQYHIVWVSKYRYRVLMGVIVQEVENCIHVISEQQGREMVEFNVQVACYLLVMAASPVMGLGLAPGGCIPAISYIQGLVGVQMCATRARTAPGKQRSLSLSDRNVYVPKFCVIRVCKKARASG